MTLETKKNAIVVEKDHAVHIYDSAHQFNSSQHTNLIHQVDATIYSSTEASPLTPLISKNIHVLFALNTLEIVEPCWSCCILHAQLLKVA